MPEFMLADECQRLMREVALLREGHERLEQALWLAHKELKAIARLGGHKKSCGLVVARIEGMVPELSTNTIRAAQFIGRR